MEISSPAQQATSLPAAPADNHGSTRAVTKNRKRRGATALEYLVALTFILVVLILAVQHLGAITGGLLHNSANATTTK